MMAEAALKVKVTETKDQKKIRAQAETALNAFQAAVESLRRAAENVAKVKEEVSKKKRDVEAKEKSPKKRKKKNDELDQQERNAGKEFEDALNKFKTLGNAIKSQLKDVQPYYQAMALHLEENSMVKIGKDSKPLYEWVGEGKITVDALLKEVMKGKGSEYNLWMTLGINAPEDLISYYESALAEAEQKGYVLGSYPALKSINEDLEDLKMRLRNSNAYKTNEKVRNMFEDSYRIVQKQEEESDQLRRVLLRLGDRETIVNIGHDQREYIRNKLLLDLVSELIEGDLTNAQKVANVIHGREKWLDSREIGKGYASEEKPHTTSFDWREDAFGRHFAAIQALLKKGINPGRLDYTEISHHEFEEGNWLKLTDIYFNGGYEKNTSLYPSADRRWQKLQSIIALYGSNVKDGFTPIAFETDLKTKRMGFVHHGWMPEKDLTLDENCRALFGKFKGDNWDRLGDLLKEHREIVFFMPELRLYFDNRLAKAVNYLAAGDEERLKTELDEIKLALDNFETVMKRAASVLKGREEKLSRMTKIEDLQGFGLEKADIDLLKKQVAAGEIPSGIRFWKSWNSLEKEQFRSAVYQAFFRASFPGLDKLIERKMVDGVSKLVFPVPNCPLFISLWIRDKEKIEATTSPAKVMEIMKSKEGSVGLQLRKGWQKDFTDEVIDDVGVHSSTCTLTSVYQPSPGKPYVQADDPTDGMREVVIKHSSKHYMMKNYYAPEREKIVLSMKVIKGNDDDRRKAGYVRKGFDNETGWPIWENEEEGHRLVIAPDPASVSVLFRPIHQHSIPHRKVSLILDRTRGKLDLGMDFNSVPQRQNILNVVPSGDEYWPYNFNSDGRFSPVVSMRVLDLPAPRVLKGSFDMLSFASGGQQSVESTVGIPQGNLEAYNGIVNAFKADIMASPDEMNRLADVFASTQKQLWSMVISPAMNHLKAHGLQPGEEALLQKLQNGTANSAEMGQVFTILRNRSDDENGFVRVLRNMEQASIDAMQNLKMYLMYFSVGEATLVPELKLKGVPILPEIRAKGILGGIVTTDVNGKFSFGTRSIDAQGNWGQWSGSPQPLKITDKNTGVVGINTDIRITVGEGEQFSLGNVTVGGSMKGPLTMQFMQYTGSAESVVTDILSIADLKGLNPFLYALRVAAALPGGSDFTVSRIKRKDLTFETLSLRSRLVSLPHERFFEWLGLGSFVTRANLDLGGMFEFGKVKGFGFEEDPTRQWAASVQETLGLNNFEFSFGTTRGLDFIQNKAGIAYYLEPKTMKGKEEAGERSPSFFVNFSNRTFPGGPEFGGSQQIMIGVNIPLGSVNIPKAVWNAICPRASKNEKGKSAEVK